MFGSSPLFGGTPSPAPAASNPFGASPSTPAPSNPFGGTPSPAPSNPFGGTPSPAPSSGFGFGFPQTPAPQASPTPFGNPNPPSPLFPQSSPSPFSQTMPSTPSLFGQTQPSTPLFGQTPQNQQQMMGQQQQQQQQQQLQPFYGNGQLTTQMAPVAAPAIPLPDRDIQAIVDTYKEDPGNPKYSFKHFFLSVTDPSMRTKPVGVYDVMWAEAMNKLEGMESSDREKLWPELALGFKDLSRRLKLQDEAIASDMERLRLTQANVKMLERHFHVDTLTWIQRLRHKEQELQRRLLRIMRIVEALEGKGLRMLSTKGEAQLAERLRAIVRQLQGPGAELPRRINNLLSISRIQGTAGDMQSLLPNLAKIDERSLDQMHEVLRQQTEAISSLVAIVKRDLRDVEIVKSDNTENEFS